MRERNRSNQLMNAQTFSQQHEMFSLWARVNHLRPGWSPQHWPRIPVFAPQTVSWPHAAPESGPAVLLGTP